MQKTILIITSFFLLLIPFYPLAAHYDAGLNNLNYYPSNNNEPNYQAWQADNGNYGGNYRLNANRFLNYNQSDNFFRNNFNITDNQFWLNNKGRIFILSEANGEAFYVNPSFPIMDYLGNSTLALKVLRDAGLGITNDNLRKIPIGIISLSGQDSDHDGLTDNFEQAIGTNPFNYDTDRDGYSDRLEILVGYNPNCAGPTTAQGSNASFINYNDSKNTTVWAFNQQRQSFVSDQNHNYPQNDFNPSAWSLSQRQPGLMNVQNSNDRLFNNQLYSNFNNNNQSNCSIKLPVDNALISRLRGRVLLQIESVGETWYLNPKDNKRYLISSPTEVGDLIRKLATGISTQDFFQLTH